MAFSHFLLLLSIILLWGFNFIAIQIALDGIPPIFLGFLRFLFCTPVLFFLKKPKAPLRQLALYGLIMLALEFSLLTIAMRSGITPGLASILIHFQSFFSITLAVIFLKEKYALSHAIGAFFAILGIVIIAAHLGGEVSPLGVGLTLLAALMWAIGSILAKKIDQASGVALVAWGSLFACPPLFLFSYFYEGPEAISAALENFSWGHLGALSYISYLSTLFCYGGWNWLLRHYPVSRLSPFSLLVPILGMISSCLLR